MSKIALRLSDREQSTLTECRLDPMLSGKSGAAPLQLSDLLSGLVAYAIMKIEHNEKFRGRLGDYLSFNQKLPLMHITPTKESRKVEDTLTGLEGVETLEEFISPEKGNTSFTSLILNDDALIHFREKISSVYEESVSITDGEIAKTLIYFLTNDPDFQLDFRTNIYLGNLYSFSSLETGRLLGDNKLKIEKERLINFKNSFTLDNRKWRDVKKVDPKEVSADSNFRFVEAYEGFAYVTLMSALYSQRNVPYVRKLVAAVRLWDDNSRKWKKREQIVYGILLNHLRMIEILLKT